MPYQKQKNIFDGSIFWKNKFRGWNEIRAFSGHRIRRDCNNLPSRLPRPAAGQIRLTGQWRTKRNFSGRSSETHQTTMTTTISKGSIYQELDSVQSPGRALIQGSVEILAGREWRKSEGSGSAGTSSLPCSSSPFSLRFKSVGCFPDSPVLCTITLCNGVERIDMNDQWSSSCRCGLFAEGWFLQESHNQVLGSIDYSFIRSPWQAWAD